MILLRFGQDAPRVFLTEEGLPTAEVPGVTRITLMGGLCKVEDGTDTPIFGEYIVAIEPTR